MAATRTVIVVTTAGTANTGNIFAPQILIENKTTTILYTFIRLINNSFRFSAILVYTVFIKLKNDKRRV
jgi:hypothetical protein